MTNLLVVEKVTKSYKKTVVLKNISLQIADEGQIIQLKGINGSGKSTLFKLISGMEKPDYGEIKLAVTTNLGALIENPGFLENFSLAYNLRYLASIKSKFDEAYVKKLCQILALDLYSRIKIKNYSVGMRQKAGIIQAIMEKQNLILLDEPSRGLDQESLQKFVTLMNQLRQEGRNIIIASHEEYEEMKIDECLKIEHGILSPISDR